MINYYLSFSRDERGKLAFAEEKGKLTAALTLVMRQLKKRFGDISETTTAKIENLSLEKLEQLGEYFLDFQSLADLESYLERR